MANKKISEFLEALSLVDNAFIPIIQGNPIDDYKISKDNFIQSLSDDNKIDINGLNASIDKLHFGVNTTTPIAYDLYQNTAEETLSIKLPDGGSLEIGKEMFEIYTNIDTVPLVNGDIVSIVQISGNRRGVKRCDVTTDNARTVVGMVTVPTIAVNGKGRVTTMGNVHELNTSTYTEGLPLYVSSTNPGKWTQTMPAAPNYIVEIGSVEVSHLNQGIVNLNLRCNPKLTDLSDVNGTPLTVDGQLPIWHNTTKVFDFDKNINDYRLLTNNVFGTVTDNTTIETDGQIKLNGTAVIYEDINTPIANAKVPAANAPSWSTFTTNTNAYTFAINDYIDLGTIEIPHSYKEGSDLEIHLHLASNGTNNAIARKAKYVIYYTYGLPDSGAYQFITESSLTAEIDINANQLDKSTLYLSLGNISGVGIKIGTQLKMRVKRIAGTGTEPINNPFLGMVGVHFISDTLGSRSRSSK